MIHLISGITSSKMFHTDEMSLFPTSSWTYTSCAVHDLPQCRCCWMKWEADWTACGFEWCSRWRRAEVSAAGQRGGTHRPSPIPMHVSYYAPNTHKSQFSAHRHYNFPTNSTIHCSKGVVCEQGVITVKYMVLITLAILILLRLTTAQLFIHEMAICSLINKLHFLTAGIMKYTPVQNHAVNCLVGQWQIVFGPLLYVQQVDKT